MQSELTTLRPPRAIWLVAVAMFVVVLSFDGANASAQQPLPQPNLNLVASGTVLAIARQADGGTIIGGLFTSVDGQPRQNIARRKPDGTLDPDWKPTFDNRVTGIAINLSGAIYVTGWFYLVDTHPRYGIAKLTSAGQLDTTWNPPVFGPAYCVVVDVDGSVFAGGSFEHAVTRDRYSLLKFSGTDGAIDPLWNPSSSIYPKSLLIDGGWLYVGGSIANVVGYTGRGLARVARTGTGSLDTAWAPFANGSVLGLALGPTGTLFVAGNFQYINNANPRPGIAKVSTVGNGTFDAAWNPSLGPVGVAQTVAVDSAGFVYAGFYRAHELGTPADDLPSLVKISSSGTGAVVAAWSPEIDGSINALQVVSTQGVQVGGTFTANGSTPALGLATVDEFGVAARAIDVESASGAIVAILPQADGSVVAGGRFSKADGIVRRNLVRILPDGKVDPEWNAGTDGDVFALVESAEGSIYAAGPFTRVGGQPRNGLVKISAGSTGAVDPNWTSPVQSGRVKSIAVHGSDAVFIGGDFQSTDVGIRYLARLNPNSGAIDGMWNPTPNGEVSSLLLDGSDGLLVGGLFTTIAGANQRALAKLDVAGTGTVDPIWNAQMLNSTSVVALTTDKNFVYAAGSIYAPGIVQQQQLGRFELSSGAVDTVWNPRDVNEGRILAIATGSDASLYTIERRYSYGYNPPIDYLQSRKIRTDDAGSKLGYWQPYFFGSGPVATLAVLGDTVYFGGPLLKVANQPRIGITAFSRVAPDAVFAQGFD